MKNHDTTAQTTAARLINALMCAFAPAEKGIDVETELLKHFPFARVGEQAPSSNSLRSIPTTAHGSL